MPRSILVNHLVLLLSASLLFGAAMGSRLQGLGDQQRPLPDGWFLTFTIVTVVTALVLFCSEWFTGVRWSGIIAVVAAVTALLGSYVWEFPGGALVVLWFVIWCATAAWFARMAFRARADR